MKRLQNASSLGIFKLKKNDFVEVNDKDLETPSDLEPYSGIVDVNIEDREALEEAFVKKISLHVAANLQAVRTGSLEDVRAVCNCTGKCSNDNRCSCFKINKKCTSHCHNKGKAAKAKLICTNR